MRTAVLVVLLLTWAGCQNVQYPAAHRDGICPAPRFARPAENRSTPGYGLLVHVADRSNEPLPGAVVWHEHGRDTANAQGIVVLPPSRTLRVQSLGYCDGWVRLSRASGRYVRVELSEAD